MQKVIHNQKSKLKSRPQVLVILGPTASGKTRLAVNLATKSDGEIVSADSRQVYRGLDVGTGKDLQEYNIKGHKIPYHLIDITNPKLRFNLARYQKLAFKALEDIINRGRLPIIVGGSGLYLQAVIDNYQLAPVLDNKKKRAALEKLGATELFKRLCKLSPVFARRLNNSEKNNARRLARYLEIVSAGGAKKAVRQKSPYDFLIIGLSWPDNILRARVEKRLLDRLEKEGLVAEVQRLHEEGLSWQRLKSFGLEYKFIAQHLSGELSFSEMVSRLSSASYRFAKRQMTWFRRWEKQGAKIYWQASLGEKDIKKVIKKVQTW